MNFTNLDIKNQYRSNDCKNIGNSFLNKLLPISESYSRAVGFFSSSSLIYLSHGLSKLYDKYIPGNPPIIRYIVSPRLSEEDINAIKIGYKSKNDIIEEAMLREFSPPTTDDDNERLNMLSHLISSGAMDIKVAVTSFSQSEIGMYHEKIGILVDKDGNKVAFTGSLNESENAYVNNFESIFVFKSWTENNSYCLNILEDFDKLWNNYTSNVQVFSFPEALKKKLLTYKQNDFRRDLDDPKKEINTIKVINHPKIDKTLTPTFPYDYQQEAIDNWMNSSCRGIFDMATGERVIIVTGCNKCFRIKGFKNFIKEIHALLRAISL